MKQNLKISLSVISLLAFVLSACNLPSSTQATPTDAVSAVYTAAAQTIVAKAALATSTPSPTVTVTPTQTPVSTATETKTGGANPTSPVSPAACDKSVYISDVTFPDNSVVAPGQVFEKTWALQNTGTCAWTTAYSMTFVSGERLGGNSTALAQAVPAQQQANISVKLTAPSVAGTYTGYWQLANALGSQFGQSVSIVIVVSGSGATTTPTPTAGTAAASNTPAITQTPTPTAAVVLTLTETPTPTVTATPP